MDILESMPNPAEPDTEALRARLGALCASQSVEATSDRIEQAVSCFLSGRQPKSTEIVAIPWNRPGSIAEWEALKITLAEGPSRLDHISRIFGSVVVISICVSMLTMCLAFLLPRAILISWTHEILGVIFTGMVSPFSVGGIYIWIVKPIILNQLPWMKKARQLAHRWLGTPALDRNAEKKLDEAPTDVTLMARWLHSPKASVALRAIAKSGVPLTVRDSNQLTTLAEADEAIDKQANDASVARAQADAWKSSMEQLANS